MYARDRIAGEFIDYTRRVMFRVFMPEMRQDHKWMASVGPGQLIMVLGEDWKNQFVTVILNSIEEKLNVLELLEELAHFNNIMNGYEEDE